MSKYEKNIIGDFEKVLTHLQKDINNSALTMNLVDKSDYSVGNTKIAIRVYDKYFARNGNRASLSLTIVGSDNNIFISAIGAGGGQGIFFNFSLGAETSMISIVEKSIEKII